MSDNDIHRSAKIGKNTWVYPYVYIEGDVVIPVATSIADTTLSLPIHPNISINDENYICNNINDFMEEMRDLVN